MPLLQDTVLDFYGVGIKAAEIRGLVDRMATLARLVEELRDPVNQFELPQARCRQPLCKQASRSHCRQRPPHCFCLTY